MSKDLYREIAIPDQEWDELEARAAAKDERSDQTEWTRRWGDKFNLSGEVGEWCFSEVFGIPRKPAGFGDGGTDFGDIDVKATTHYATPKLLRLATDPLKAPLWALVAVDIKKHLARYIGWATRAELAAAPHVEYGYGPTRTLEAEALHRDFPVDSPYLELNLVPEVLFNAERGRRERLGIPLGLLAR